MPVSISSRPDPDAVGSTRIGPVLGDPIALLDEGFKAFYITTYRYLVHRLFDCELAEELTAETFFKAAGVGQRLPPDAQHLQMWLLRVATNLANSHHRKAKLHRLLLGRLANGSISTLPAPEPDEENEMGVRCRATLRTLPAKYQAVVVLRYFSEMSFTDIATILECRETTVRARLSRAVRMLRERLVN